MANRIEMLKHGIRATIRYEIARSLNLGRGAAFLVLALFPPAITAIICRLPGAPPTMIPIGVTSLVVCVLANLVWSTSAVSGELEGKTWAYLAARPGGRIASMIGKYIVSVGWTALVTLSALTMAIAVQALLVPTGDELRLWLIFASCGLIACFAYASIYTLLGTIFHRRAMVAAVVHTGVFELMIGWIPGIIQYATVRGPLVHLAVIGLVDKEVLEDPNFTLVFGEPNVIGHLISVVCLTIVALLASLWLIRTREYATTQEV
ncbi:MAG TPA: hypothetical protein PLI18_13560 [Pirellulaceae bacterium]|nr:hypothetical protein [Pirellulaceae bacterium]